MKTSLKMLVLAIAALFVTSFTTLNANTGYAATQQHASATGNVSDAEIIEFMSDRGFTVTAITHIEGTTNVKVTVVGGRKFVLYIVANEIRDWEEVLS
ncbi:MAG: hypothetical protein MUC87_12900 [Bacteroidia bacterium]|jgi:hypothetical protein|nr:hypothetical protein [Bacteroidia bacterium]